MFESETSQSNVRELLDYDMDSGVFRGRSRAWYRFKTKRDYGTWHKQYKGKLAGYINAKGYLIIRLPKSAYAAHTLAWIYIYGETPDGVIDHINGNKVDNRIVNLRNVSQKENTKNARLSKRNISGCNGVRWDNSKNKWTAYIGVNYKKINLGSFDNLDDAISARKEADTKYGFHENHGAVNRI